MISVFISSSREDSAIAHRVRDALTHARVRAWLDDPDIEVGDDIPQAIERGIASSDYLAVILTPRAVTSRWVRDELSAFQMEGAGKILPLLFEDCETPPLLRAKKYADFRLSFEQGLEQTLRAIGVPVPPVAVPDVDHGKVLSSLSLVWDLRGKYRYMPWGQLRREAEETRGGEEILAEDLLEMVEYKSAPFREHAQVLREAVRTLLSDAGDADADLLARLVVSAWEHHEDNIGAAWLLALMPKSLAALVLTRTYAMAPATAKWVMRTLYDFAATTDPLVFEADLIKRAGHVPDELSKIARGNYS